MAKIKFSGPVLMRVSSFAILSAIAISTFARQAFGRRMEPSWNAAQEIGIRFVRRQFTRAMAQPDMAKGRQMFDSLQTETDDTYAVGVKDSTVIKGQWHIPKTPKSRATLLYLHGGGYALHGGVSVRFASMLAHHTGARLFAPDYRLTPEHPHPAQAEDALVAWHYVAATCPPEQIVVIGDSAGGHMALMLLQTLRAVGQAQPALCIGLCPWTDIGARGDSLAANDRYDLVQGWMALRFGEWLDPKGAFGREALSPINQDYAGLAPLYLQAGGREVLHDMIAEFAAIQTSNGADVTLDVWQDMPHVFQAYDSWTRSSREAIARICRVIEGAISRHSPDDDDPTQPDREFVET
jgi:epsilon-lactone hydrolase